MAEKFRKIVNAPHKAFGRAKEKVKSLTPETNGQKVARAAGIGTLGMFHFLVWVTKYVALDNHLLRGLEKNLAEITKTKNKDGKDKKAAIFMKNNPNLSAHLLYYMMLVLMIGGGKVAIQQEKSRQAKQIQINKNKLKLPTDSYNEYMQALDAITPLLMVDLIAKEGTHIKNGLHIPYKDSQGIWTIGYGSTKLRNGAKVKKNTAPITNDEALDLMKWHLYNETYLYMYWYTVGAGVDFSDVQAALGVASIMYNAGSKLMEEPEDYNHKERFEKLRQDTIKYGLNIPTDVVEQRFNEHPITNPRNFGRVWFDGGDAKDASKKMGNYLVGGPGILWRRWLEAGSLNGELEPGLLLDCPVNGVYEFFEYIGRDKSNYFISSGANYKTFEKFEEWLQNPVNANNESLQHWQRIADMVPQDVIDACNEWKNDNDWTQNLQNAKYKPQKTKKQLQKTEFNRDKEYKRAIKAYNDGKYKKAEKIFQEMLEIYSDDALLYNDLAATYNKLGKYDDAIAQANEILHRIGDKSQYGAAQYNAGFAYEQKGDLDKALANYQLAVKNGNNNAKSDVQRVQKKINECDNSAKKATVFNAGKDKLKSAVGAADSGIAQIFIPTNTRNA